MQEIYKRKLRYSEAEGHYIRVSKEYRNMFPPAGVPFTVVVNNQKFEVIIGSSNRIWAAVFWEKLPHFREGDTIVFSKSPHGFFNVSIEE